MAQMTQAIFNTMFNEAMDAYLAEEAARPVSDWAKDAWAIASKPGVCFTVDKDNNGTPGSPITVAHLGSIFRKLGINADLSIETLLLKKLKPTFTKHMTKQQLVDMGFAKINRYYFDTSTNERSNVIDCSIGDVFIPDPVIAKHRPDISQRDVDNINRVLSLFEINNRKRICAFFAQVLAECGKGADMVEAGGTLSGKPVTRTNLKDWFVQNRKYPFKYRGAGGIQLTHDYNYESFEKYVGDKNITLYGAEYVGYMYPWLAAGWFWKNQSNKGNLNPLADKLSGNKIPINTGNADYIAMSDITKGIMGNGAPRGDIEKRIGNYNTTLDKITT